MIASMDYSFRPYARRDKKNCARIIAPTWRFDEYFPGTKNTEALNTFVIERFFMYSDYTDTAVVQNGGKEECAAFLFAHIKRTGLHGVLYRAKKSLLLFGFYLRVFVLWFAGFYGRRAPLQKAFSEYKTLEQKLFEGVEYDAEILCLFVDEKAQGKGLAKMLLMRFFQWAERRNLKQFVLATDTDCNYRFYDNHGFTRMRQIRGCLGVPQSACSGAHIFLYGIYLEGNA